MLVSSHGTLVRTRVSGVSQAGRNTQGVLLIRFPDDEKLVGAVKIGSEDDDAVVANGVVESDNAAGE